MSENCIVDVCCGGRLPTSYWADWEPDKKVVVFGGDWWTIPDMPAEVEPSYGEVLAWAKKWIGLQGYEEDFDEWVEMCGGFREMPGG